MYEFRCADAGATSCGGRVAAQGEDELRKKLAKHVAKKHGIKEPNDTLVDHLVAVTRRR